MNTLIVSMVANGFDTKPRAVSVMKVLAGIKEGRWHKQVESIRQTFMKTLEETKDLNQAKKSIAEAKANLAAIIVTGVFDERNDKGLKQSSGLIVVDLDNLAPSLIKATRAVIIQDPSVLSCFKSPSGAGLKIFYACTSDGSPAAHAMAFEMAKERAMRTGCPVDESGKNLSRLCYVSDDDEIYINANAAPFEVVLEDEETTPYSEFYPAPAGFNLHARQQIAASLLGPPIQYDGGRTRIKCPGYDLHNNVNKPTDCTLYLEGRSPTIKCFHGSCSEAVAAANFTLRSEISKAEGPKKQQGVVVYEQGGPVFDSESGEGTSISTLPWPDPVAPMGFRGLAGRIIDALDPHTEADRAAMLIHFLSAFGCMCGPAPHYYVSGTRHPARIWAVVVGDTSTGRKGTAWSTVKFFLSLVDRRWTHMNVKSGTSSGEGLIYHLRDPQFKTEDGEEVMVDEGIQDKRLFLVEPEFSSVLKVASRERNITSNILRQGWEDGNLGNLTKNSPMTATNAHLCMVGHITKADLSKYMVDCEVFNGFANRYLWICSRRSKILPRGGELHLQDLSKLVKLTELALSFARGRSEIRRSANAEELWEKEYHRIAAIKRKGVLDSVLAREEAQLLRLSVIFAMLDCSNEVLVDHIQAAIAVWRYCEASARHIFSQATGDKLADKILKIIQDAVPDGVSQVNINRGLKNNTPGPAIEVALKLLLENRFVRYQSVKIGGSQKPTTMWFAGS